jgi:hypothetical protein
MKRFILGFVLALTVAIAAGVGAQTVPVRNFFSRCAGSNCDNVFNLRGTVKIRHGSATSSTDMNPIGSYVPNLTAVGNGADQTEDNLQTFPLGANALDATGKGVYIYAAGSTGANGDSKDVSLYFGATKIATIAANTANAKGWEAEAFCWKTGANAQLCTGYAQVDTTASTIFVTTPAETDTGAITIKTTGKENTANTANSVVSKVLVVQGAR